MSQGPGALVAVDIENAWPVRKRLAARPGGFAPLGEKEQHGSLKPVRVSAAAACARANRLALAGEFTQKCARVLVKLLLGVHAKPMCAKGWKQK